MADYLFNLNSKYKSYKSPYLKNKKDLLPRYHYRKNEMFQNLERRTYGNSQGISEKIYQRPKEFSAPKFTKQNVFSKSMHDLGHKSHRFTPNSKLKDQRYVNKMNTSHIGSQDQNRTLKNLGASLNESNKDREAKLRDRNLNMNIKLRSMKKNNPIQTSEKLNLLRWRTQYNYLKFQERRKIPISQQIDKEQIDNYNNLENTNIDSEERRFNDLLNQRISHKKSPDFNNKYPNIIDKDSNQLQFSHKTSKNNLNVKIDYLEREIAKLSNDKNGLKSKIWDMNQNLENFKAENQSLKMNLEKQLKYNDRFEEENKYSLKNKIIDDDLMEDNISMSDLNTIDVSKKLSVCINGLTDLQYNADLNRYDKRFLKIMIDNLIDIKKTGIESNQRKGGFVNPSTILHKIESIFEHNQFEDINQKMSQLKKILQTNQPNNDENSSNKNRVINIMKLMQIERNKEDKIGYNLDQILQFLLNHPNKHQNFKKTDTPVFIKEENPIKKIILYEKEKKTLKDLNKNLNDKNESLKNKLDQITTELNEFKGRHSSKNSKHMDELEQRFQEELSKRIKEINQLKSENKMIAAKNSQEIKEMKMHCNLVDRDIRAYLSELKIKEDFVASLKMEKQNLSNNLKKNESKLFKKSQIIDTLTQELKKMKKSVDSQKNHEDNENLKKEKFIELERINNELRDSNNDMKKKLEESIVKVKHLQDSLFESEYQKKLLQANVEDLEQKNQIKKTNVEFEALHSSQTQKSIKQEEFDEKSECEVIQCESEKLEKSKLFSFEDNKFNSIILGEIDKISWNEVDEDEERDQEQQEQEEFDKMQIFIQNLMNEHQMKEKSLKAEIFKLQDQMEEFMKQKNDYEIQIQKAKIDEMVKIQLKKERDNFKLRYDELREIYQVKVGHDQDDEKENLKKDNQMLLNDIIDYKTNLENLSNDLEDKILENNMMKKSIIDFEERLDIANQKIDQYSLDGSEKTKIDELVEKLNLSVHNNKELKSELALNFNQISSLEKHLKELEKKINNQDTTDQEKDNKIKNYKIDLDHLTEQIAEKSDDLNKQYELIKQLNQTIKEFRLIMEEKEEEMDFVREREMKFFQEKEKLMRRIKELNQKLESIGDSNAN